MNVLASFVLSFKQKIIIVKALNWTTQRNKLILPVVVFGMYMTLYLNPKRVNIFLFISYDVPYPKKSLAETLTQHLFNIIINKLNNPKVFHKRFEYFQLPV